MSSNSAPEAAVDKPEEENLEYISGIKLYLVLASITLVAFLLMLDLSILSTATPRITSAFHSLSDVGWYVGAYPLSNAALQPLSGKIYTHFSAKWVFLGFFFIFEFGSLLCGAAQSSNMLIVGRSVAGMGGAGIINGAVTILAGAVPLEKRAQYTGMLMGISTLGIISGPLIGGALTQYTTWRWCFFINLPIGGFVAILLVLIRIPDLTVKPPFSTSLVRKVIPKLDLFGFVLFAPAAIMLLLALQFGSGNQYAWNSATIIGLFCGSGAMAILFFLWERRVGENAMIPGSLVRQRVVWATAVNAWGLFAVVNVTANYLPWFFQAVKGASPTQSGVDSLPSILAQLVFVVASGVSVTKLGYYLPWATASGAVNAIANGLISTWTPSTSTARWIGIQIILGVGRGAGMQIPMIAIQNVVTPSQIPTALAFIVFCQNIGGAVSVVAATTIFTQSLEKEIAKHAPSVSIQAALAAGGGADAVRALLPKGSPELPSLLEAFAKSLGKIYYFLVAVSIVAFAVSFGMGWIDVRKKKDGTDAEAAPTEGVAAAVREVDLEKEGSVNTVQSKKAVDDVAV